MSTHEKTWQLLKTGKLARKNNDLIVRSWIGANFFAKRVVSSKNTFD